MSEIINNVDKKKIENEFGEDIKKEKEIKKEEEEIEIEEKEEVIIEIPVKEKLKEEISQKEDKIENEIINENDSKEKEDKIIINNNLEIGNNQNNESKEIDQENIKIEIENAQNLQKNKNCHFNSDFEKNIKDAYQILAKFTANQFIIKSTNSDEKEEEDNIETPENINMICEKKLRSALQICENDPELVINRNIIQQIYILSHYNKMNLNYIIGNIYIRLMNKDTLFDYNDPNFLINDLLSFINKVILFKDIIQNTNINYEYNNSLKKFLFIITEKFDLDEDQLNGIKTVLESNKEIEHANLITDNFENFINSLTQELESQPNIYEQYEVFNQNKSTIINLIENMDVEDTNNYKNYFLFGKMLAYLFYNKNFNIHLESNNKNKNEEDDCIKYLLFNGHENKNEIKLINKKDFYIFEDNRIAELKEKLCAIILKYIEKTIVIELYSIQYVIFILLKRIYFCHYKKYNKQVISLLADSLVNMCFFKESSLELIFSFINKKIKSSKNEDLELKNKLLENIDKVKNKENFLYKFPKSFKIKKENGQIGIEEEKEESEGSEEKEEEENNEGDIDEGFYKEKNEIIYLYQNNLNIGFFNSKIIYAGEKFVFYEEIKQAYSVLEFSIYLDDMDINLKITDLTEEREIFSKERINNKIENPLKIIMFFTNARTLQFEFDNSYSWFKPKSIKYKTNIFCPEYPYTLGHQLLLSNYEKDILKNKNLIMKKKKANKNIGNKLLIFQIDDKNKVLNCINVKQNINAINKMIKDKYLSIYSILLKLKNNKKKENNEDKSKSYFYYYKENEGLIENELTKEIFSKFLNDLLLNSTINLNIINLYIINGDSNANILCNQDSLHKLLGFDPMINVEGNFQKILFFIQNLSQAQIIYYLYKQVYNQEQIGLICLINYTKYGGYQIILFNNEEIIYNLKDFKGINKNASIDENIKIIIEGIKKLKEYEEQKIEIVLTVSMDDKENDIVQDKLEKKLIENIGQNENDKKYIKIIKTDFQFNIDLQIGSHVFYLDNK